MKQFKIRKRNASDYFGVCPSMNKRSPVTLSSSNGYDSIEWDFPTKAARAYANEILAVCDAFDVGVSHIIEERP